MKQVDFYGIVRSIMVAIGAYLIGRNIYGVNVTDEFWTDLVGVVLAIAGIGWSVYDKTIVLESVQGVIRQIITFIGGVLVARGTIKTEVLLMALGFVQVIAPPIYGFLSRMKTYQLHTGEIKLNQLKK